MPMLAAGLLLALVIALTCEAQTHMAAASNPYTVNGPYSLLKTKGHITVKADGGSYDLTIYLTAPGKDSSGRRPPNNSLPSVLMFVGFMCEVSWYTGYAELLASWGYAVIQYDGIPFLERSMFKDSTEIQFVPYLFAWLKDQGQYTGSPVYQLLDNTKQAMLGHSRGGKLAALSAAKKLVDVQTVVLLDPVDLNPITKLLHFPSAVDAMKLHPLKGLLIGAGKNNPCNPKEETWRKFYGDSSQYDYTSMVTGSWLEVLKDVTHMDFTEAGDPWSGLIDIGCQTNKKLRPFAVEQSQSSAVAWLDSQFKPEQAALVQQYITWARQQSVATGTFTFGIKGTDPTPSDPVVWTTGTGAASSWATREVADAQVMAATEVVNQANAEPVLLLASDVPFHVVTADTKVVVAEAVGVQSDAEAKLVAASHATASVDGAMDAELITSHPILDPELAITQ